MLRSLDDDKAVEVVSIPLSGKSNIADYMVIACGPLDPPGRRRWRRSSPSGSSASSAAASAIEGLPVADWVLIDADDVIVHLFRPEVRSFYNLERMWAFEESAPAAARGRQPTR